MWPFKKNQPVTREALDLELEDMRREIRRLREALQMHGRISWHCGLPALHDVNRIQETVEALARHLNLEIHHVASRDHIELRPAHIAKE